MKLKLRPEPFGCIVFNPSNRKHVFVKADHPIRELVEQVHIAAIEETFHGPVSDHEIEVVGGNSNSRLSAPLCLYLEITNYCTIRCAHCYKPESTRVPGLGLDDFYRLIDQAKEMGIFEVRLCGNEPAISPYFLDICRYSRDFGLFISLNTSGVIGPIRRRQIIDFRPDQVVVSVDGDRQSNDSIRVSGAYDQACLLLEMLRDAGISRRINSVISKATLSRMDNVVQLAENVHTGISFIPIRTMGRPTQFKDTSSLTRSEMREAVSYITKAKREWPHVPMETFFDILGNGFWAHHTMDVNIPCPAGKNLFVAATGKVYPCDWLRYLGDTYCCGDVSTESLSQIWSHSATLQGFHGIRRKKCEGCSHYLRSCYGGCWCSYGDSIAAGDYEDRLCFASLIMPS